MMCLYLLKTDFKKQVPNKQKRLLEQQFIPAFNQTLNNISWQILLLDMKLKVNMHAHLGNTLPGT